MFDQIRPTPHIAMIFSITLILTTLSMLHGYQGEGSEIQNVEAVSSMYYIIVYYSFSYV